MREAEAAWKEVAPGGCRHLDRVRGRCLAYAERPLDCRLFPLDLDYRDGRLYWVTWPSVCPMARDEELLTEAAERAEVELLPLAERRMAEEYAQADYPPFERFGPWAGLREVRGGVLRE